MFVVVGRTVGCRWCDKAKQLLAEQGLPHKFFEAEGVVADLLEAMDMRTVPRIWHASTYVGGFRDLELYLAERPGP